MKINIKYVVLSILGIAVFTYYVSNTFAQSCSTITITNPRADGLTSTPKFTAGSKFGTTSGACIVDPNAAFAPYKIPTYNDLKSLYYDQAKQSGSITKHDAQVGDKNEGDIRMTTGNDHLYYIKKTNSTSTDGNLTISSNISGNQTGVVFVDGNLNITSNLTTANSGLVFVVKGDVNIDKTVQQIDAVIISEGTICTAYDGTCPATNVPNNSQPLVINGSLISLNESKPIKFKRSLADNNSLPAEKINHQIKYLVILRNLFSDTFQRWSEIP